MRNKIGFLIGMALAVLACEDEEKPIDPVYEFVSFKGPSIVNINEFNNSTNAFPLVVEIRAFEPYAQDVDITLEVTGNNTAPNTDFIVTPESVKLRAGSLVSDTIFIQTIDNDLAATEERSFDIRIASVSQENVLIGLGIAEPKNASVRVVILDDECDKTISIFNDSLQNTIGNGSGDILKTATGVVTDNTLKVTGDLIDYGAFPDASINITLSPGAEGSTKGTAMFGEQEVGTDSDGYDYKFVQTGEGAYDVCSGVITVAYDIFYWDGDWVFWYSVTNEFSAG